MADISSITVGGTNYSIKDSNAIRIDTAASGDIILTANDSYSIRPATTNYCGVGESSYRFYRGYINNLYVKNIYVASSMNSTTESYGTAGQVLTSNGSSNAYWSTPVKASDCIAKDNGIFSGYLVPDLGNNLAGYLGKSGNYITGAYINSLYPTRIYAAENSGSSTLSYGSAGQVLTSSGNITNPVYWSTPSSGGVSGDYLPLSGGTMSGLITFTANDSYGLVPATNNYCKIGSSTNYFYQGYINNIYVSKIYAASSSSSSTKSYGTAGQVLTSNGSGNLYWSTPSSGSSITVDSSLSSSSTNPVQNKVIYNRIVDLEADVSTVSDNLDNIADRVETLESSGGSSYNMATQLYSGSTASTTFSNYSSSKGGMVVINGLIAAEDDGYGNFQFVIPIYATSGTVTLYQCVYSYSEQQVLRIAITFSLSTGRTVITSGNANIISAYQVY